MSSTVAERPLAFHTRADLRVRSYRVRGREHWNVKDPLTLRYYQLRAEEYFLLDELRSPTSLAELQARFEERFAPRRVKVSQLQAFLASLHREGLILSDARGQGEQLLARRSRLRRREVAKRLTNILAIRFRGFDPDAMLDHLYPKVRWLFSRMVFAVLAALVLFAAGFAAYHHSTIAVRMPAFTSFLTVKSAIWLFVAIGFTKVIHELGHALTCKHFGGECHELGFMLLVFSPCLYCDVTDSWMSPNKWRRIAVAGAGILVELVLASVAFFIWWYSEPGFVNSACFSLMAVCSISTVVFNGNPLLRYDGYFVLSDLIELPNLSQRSSELMRRWFSAWAMGIEPDERLAPEPRKKTLAVYAVAAAAYRVFVLGAIFWFVFKALEAFDLEHFAFLLGVIVVAGILAGPLSRTYRLLKHPKGIGQMKLLNVLITCLLISAAVWLVGWAPLPHYVTAPAVVRPADAKRVFVTIPGNLKEAALAGQRVERSEPIGLLSDVDLERRIAELQARRDEQALHLENLNKRRALNVEADSQIPLAQKTLQELESQLDKRRSEREQLVLKSPAEGWIIPPPPRVMRTAEPTSWSGTPLDPENRNCYLDRQSLFCLVGDPNRLEVVLIVEQSQVEFVDVGQRVRVQFDQLAGEILEGEVVEIAEGDLEYAPRELISAGEMPAAADATGAARPASTSYQARVLLKDVNRPLVIGATGNARLYTEPRTIARRVWRFLNRTFHMQLVT